MGFVITEREENYCVVGNRMDSLDVYASSCPASVGPGGVAHRLVAGLKGTLDADGAICLLHDEWVLLYYHRVDELAILLQHRDRAAGVSDSVKDNPGKKVPVGRRCI